MTLQRKCLLSAASLAGILLGFMGQQLWADVKTNTGDIRELKTQRETDSENIRRLLDKADRLAEKIDDVRDRIR